MPHMIGCPDPAQTIGWPDERIIGHHVVRCVMEVVSPFINLAGPRLLFDLPITFAQAALGDELEVPTVEAVARVTVPHGVQTGEVLRLRGQGLPGLHGRGKGDQLVRIRVWTQKKLTNEQERVLKELREMEDAPPENTEIGEEKGFWSKMKEAFS